MVVSVIAIMRVISSPSLASSSRHCDGHSSVILSRVPSFPTFAVTYKYYQLFGFLTDDKGHISYLRTKLTLTIRLG